MSVSQAPLEFVVTLASNAASASPTPAQSPGFSVGGLMLPWSSLGDAVIAIILSFLTVTIVVHLIQQSADQEKLLKGLLGSLPGTLLAGFKLVTDESTRIPYAAGLSIGVILAYLFRGRANDWLGAAKQLEAERGEHASTKRQATTAYGRIGRLRMFAVSMHGQLDYVISKISVDLKLSRILLGDNYLVEDGTDSGKIEEIGLTICLWRNGLIIFQSTYLEEDQRIRSDARSIIYRTFMDGSSLDSPDDVVETSYLRLLTGDPNPMKMRATFPLLANKKMIGVLFADRQLQKPFSKGDREYLEAICALIGEPLGEVK